MSLYKMTHQAEVLLQIRVGLVEESGRDAAHNQVNRALSEIRKLGDKLWCEIDAENVEPFDVDTIPKGAPANPVSGDYEQAIGRDAFLAFRRSVMIADRAFQAAGDAGTKTWLREYLFPQLAEEGLMLVLKTDEKEA